MRYVWLAAVVVSSAVFAEAAQPELDTDSLVASYKAYDESKNEGRGASDRADSGSLGWVVGSSASSGRCGRT